VGKRRSELEMADKYIERVSHCQQNKVGLELQIEWE